MNRFVVSARKYRPSLFEEVRGQPHVTITLRNQLKEKTVPQVVLFCGPRGTGKTSCGRIFAKAINCLALQSSGEPCNRCVSCQQFQQKTSLNIHELDAASHNSVEDARQLLEQVRYHAATGKKVFIIDEVHMLSNAAFNVLLKTLEEPPRHVVFILATTEKHKIITTILSRCQVFDFLPIPTQEIFDQLVDIAREEGMEAEKEALHLISEYSEGSLREALHAFDKIVAFGGGKEITKEGVLSHLHILDYTYYFKLTDRLIEGRMGEALHTYDEILRLGFESHHFLQGLMKHVRHLLVAKTAAHILQMAPKMVTRYGAQAERVEGTFLCEVLEVLEQCELHYKERQDKRLHVELMLIKLARLGAVDASGAEGVPYKAATSASEGSQEGLVETKKVPPLFKEKVSLSPPQAVVPPPTSPQERKEGEVSLTLEKIKEAWNAYMEKLKAKGAMSAYATLKSPLRLEGHTVILEITNALQRNTLHVHAHDLLVFMQNTLESPSLRITTRVVSSPEENLKNAPLKAKMDHFVEKYPVVEALRTALELTTP